jgi:hypothetical protein
VLLIPGAMIAPVAPSGAAHDAWPKRIPLAHQPRRCTRRVGFPSSALYGVLAPPGQTYPLIGPTDLVQKILICLAIRR